MAARETIAQHRAERPARRRHLLYERACATRRSFDLDRNNVEVLQEQLRQTQRSLHGRRGDAHRRRPSGGEPRRRAGDRAAARSRPCRPRSPIIARRSASSRRILRRSSRWTSRCRRRLTEAIAISQVEHPAIVGSLHGVDAAELNVKVIEGALYPTVGADRSGLAAGSTRRSGPSPIESLTASLMGQITIPIYDGGATYAATRQAKEQLGQQELQTDLQRDKVRAAVVSAWGVNANSVGDHPLGQGAGRRRRDRARRRSRGGQGRPAHDVRRAHRPADAAQCARAARFRAARSGGRVLRGDVGDRPVVDRQSRACGDPVRPEGSFRPGQRQMVRPAHAGWSLT